MLVEVKVPQLSESVAEATLVNWHKQTGEYVNRDENLVDIETDKVVLETPAPQAGVLVKINKPDGGTVTSNEVIAQIDTEAAKPAAPAGVKTAPAQKAEAKPAAPTSARPAPAMPAAQKLAAEKNMDTASIAGTGRGGRVTKGDVLHAVEGGAPPAANERGNQVSRSPAPSTRGASASASSGAAGRSWRAGRPARSSAFRCRGCARASPSASCSRSRPLRS